MLTYFDTGLGFAAIMLGLSLLITVVVQLISTLFSSRGANLRWGLTVLFKEIDSKQYPNVAANAKALAEKVLAHPLLSDSLFSKFKGGFFRRIQLATAIRPGELVAVLKEIASDPAKHGLPASINTEIDGLLKAANPVAERLAELLKAAAPAVAPAITSASAGIQQAIEAVERAPGRLDAWFHATMDRVSQRFAIQMRLWTIALACVVAVVGRVDSQRIISDLYGSAGAREAVASGAGSMLPVASDVLKETPQFYQASLKQALADPAVNLSGKAPAEVVTYLTGVQWIEANVPEDKRADVLSAYTKASDASVRTYAADRAQKGKTILAILGGTGVRILPSPFPRWNELGRDTGWLGIVITAAFLALGAPFWFNALKSLSSLRPVVAAKTQPGKPA